MAEVVAATHDADKSADMASADSFWDDVAVCFSGAELYVDGFLSYFCCCE